MHSALISLPLVYSVDQMFRLCPKQVTYKTKQKKRHSLQQLQRHLLFPAARRSIADESFETEPQFRSTKLAGFTGSMPSIRKSAEKNQVCIPKSRNHISLRWQQQRSSRASIISSETRTTARCYSIDDMSTSDQNEGSDGESFIHEVDKSCSRSDGKPQRRGSDLKLIDLQLDPLAECSEDPLSEFSYNSSKSKATTAKRSHLSSAPVCGAPPEKENAPAEHKSKKRQVRTSSTRKLKGRIPLLKNRRSRISITSTASRLRPRPHRRRSLFRRKKKDCPTTSDSSESSDDLKVAPYPRYAQIDHLLWIIMVAECASTNTLCM